MNYRVIILFFLLVFLWINKASAEEYIYVNVTLWDYRAIGWIESNNIINYSDDVRSYGNTDTAEYFCNLKGGVLVDYNNDYFYGNNQRFDYDAGQDELDNRNSYLYIKDITCNIALEPMNSDTWSGGSVVVNIENSEEGINKSIFDVETIDALYNYYAFLLFLWFFFRFFQRLIWSKDKWDSLLFKWF